jgi:hypothetical protein
MYSLDYFRGFATEIKKGMNIPKTAKYWKSELALLGKDIFEGYDTIDLFYTCNKGIISKYYFRIANRINIEQIID